jgi:magnesium chelatase family protein
MDRIDIHVEVTAMELKDSKGTSVEEPSASIRERFSHARFVQLKRFGDQSKVTFNARMTPRLIRKYCALDPESMELLKKAVTNLSRRARAYDRKLKVARTTADLVESPRIQVDHFAEAVQYRPLIGVYGESMYGGYLDGGRSKQNLPALPSAQIGASGDRRY